MGRTRGIDRTRGMSRIGGGRRRILIEHEDETLADAADTANDLAGDRLDRRIDGAQDEWTVEREPLEAASDDVACQRVEVNDNVRQFGQRLKTDD